PQGTPGSSTTRARLLVPLAVRTMSAAAKYRCRLQCIVSKSRRLLRSPGWQATGACPLSKLPGRHSTDRQESVLRGEVDEDDIHVITFARRRSGMAMTFDPEAVRTFEHAGWQRAAAHYVATFARATRGFIVNLLDAAHVEAGMRVLDLACGPGFVSAAIAERGAQP